MRLDGKLALVTGGGGGIGGAIAEAFAQAGAVVMVADIDRDAAEAIASRIRDGGGRAHAVAVDVTDEASVADLFARAAGHGPLDILLTSAGLSDKEDIFHTDLAEWRRILDVNLTGTFLCAKQAAVVMRDQGRGRMIFIGSPTGFRGALRGHVAYAASKGGQFSMAKTLARTLAPYRVTVNVLTPGQTDTPLLWRTNPKEAMDKIVAAVPLGLAQPSDVAAGAVFLASDEAGHITGISLDIDGGGVMR